jgi:hypothetical protein
MTRVPLLEVKDDADMQEYGSIQKQLLQSKYFWRGKCKEDEYAFTLIILLKDLQSYRTA